MISRTKRDVLNKKVSYEILATIAHAYNTRKINNESDLSVLDAMSILKTCGLPVPSYSVMEGILKDVEKGQSDNPTREVEVGPVLYSLVEDLEKRLYTVIYLLFTVIYVLVIIIITILANNVV